MATKSTKYAPRAVGSTFRSKVLQAIADAGGDVSSEQLFPQLEAIGIPREQSAGGNRYAVILKQLSKQRLIRVTAKTRGGPYQIKLTSNAALQAKPAALPVVQPRKVNGATQPHQPLEIRAAPVKAEAPDGVAVHLQGAFVNVYVDGERTRFSRRHFAQLTDFFSIMNGKV